MSKPNAEQAEPLSELDQEINEALEADAKEEPAPQEDEHPEVEKPEATTEIDPEDEETDLEPKVEKPEKDGFQKRIDKVTADKHDALRRADEAERKLAEMQEPPKPLKEPKLDDFDFDEKRHSDALVDYRVELRVQERQQKQKEDNEKQSQERATNLFVENSNKFAKDKKDFNEILAQVPILQPTVLREIQESKQGPAIAYFLGKHLDIARKIVAMNPVAGGIEIGKISAKLSVPKQIKPSGAPDPIDPISSNGTTAKERGPKGATFE